eukprot:Awhi_evm1s1598
MKSSSTLFTFTFSVLLFQLSVFADNRRCFNDEKDSLPLKVVHGEEYGHYVFTFRDVVKEEYYIFSDYKTNDSWGPENVVVNLTAQGGPTFNFELQAYDKRDLPYLYSTLPTNIRLDESQSFYYSSEHDCMGIRHVHPDSLYPHICDADPNYMPTLSAYKSVDLVLVDALTKTEYYYSDTIVLDTISNINQSSFYSLKIEGIENTITINLNDCNDTSFTHQQGQQLMQLYLVTKDIYNYKSFDVFGSSFDRCESEHNACQAHFPIPFNAVTPKLCGGDEGTLPQDFIPDQSYGHFEYTFLDVISNKTYNYSKYVLQNDFYNTVTIDFSSQNGQMKPFNFQLQTYGYDQLEELYLGQTLPSNFKLSSYQVSEYDYLHTCIGLGKGVALEFSIHSSNTLSTPSFRPVVTPQQVFGKETPTVDSDSFSINDFLVVATPSLKAVCTPSLTLGKETPTLAHAVKTPSLAPKAAITPSLMASIDVVAPTSEIFTAAIPSIVAEISQDIDENSTTAITSTATSSSATTVAVASTTTIPTTTTSASSSTSTIPTTAEASITTIPTTTAAASTTTIPTTAAVASTTTIPTTTTPASTSTSSIDSKVPIVDGKDIENNDIFSEDNQHDINIQSANKENTASFASNPTTKSDINNSKSKANDDKDEQKLTIILAVTIPLAVLLATGISIIVWFLMKRNVTKDANMVNNGSIEEGSSPHSLV